MLKCVSTGLSGYIPKSLPDEEIAIAVHPFDVRNDGLVGSDAARVKQVQRCDRDQGDRGEDQGEPVTKRMPHASVRGLAGLVRGRCPFAAGGETITSNVHRLAPLV